MWDTLLFNISSDGEKHLILMTTAIYHTYFVPSQPVLGYDANGKQLKLLKHEQHIPMITWLYSLIPGWCYKTLL